MGKICSGASSVHKHSSISILRRRKLSQARINGHKKKEANKRYVQKEVNKKVSFLFLPDELNRNQEKNHFFSTLRTSSWNKGAKRNSMKHLTQG
jgi:hypothetical protein